ncbi:MAG TPA: type II secretion system F family protein [Candidatus Lumbricidophila sp.]|nr:type II secretion system F family protein [Candidatus Lumbricidophila sp.]
MMYIGMVLLFLGGLVLIGMVFAPPARRVAARRRIAPGTVYQSAVSRVVSRAGDRAVEAVGSRVAFGAAHPFSEASLELAGIKTNPQTFLISVVSAAGALSSIGVLLGLGLGPLPTVLFGAIGLVLGPVAAVVIVRMRTAKRRAIFADQLDDTLQLLAGNLRAGHGLSQAIDAVSRYAESPTAEEFARIANESRIGRDLGEVLMNTADRMNSDDFKWAAQAIGINRETGGNLAEVLLRTAATIRERNQIRRQVKALSAEGRMSASILIGLPIVVFAIVLIMQPNYLAPFFADWMGIAALCVALVLMTIGTIWMSAVVKVKF